MGRYFFRRFLSINGFFNRGFTIAVFRPRGTMSVVRDVLMMFVMIGKRMSIFLQKCGGDGIEFTRFRRCTLNYFQDKVISDRVKGLKGISVERGIRGNSWV